MSASVTPGGVVPGGHNRRRQGPQKQQDVDPAQRSQAASSRHRLPVLLRGGSPEFTLRGSRRVRGAVLTPGATMKALSIQGLAKTYGNGVQALKGIDLDVEEGDFFALLGPNGAGKTTAIGIITSLVTKTSGSVRVFGHDIDSDLERAKSCIGLVPQEINFNQFEKVFTIVVNQAGFYGIPRKQARERAEKYLHQLQLWDKRDSIARALSGGMKRRLMIARALVHEPKLLILDEPTAGVDIEIRRSMWTFLSGINRGGTTIILTTHYLEEAENLCRDVAIIDRGRIIEHDTMANVIRKLHQETFVLNFRDPVTSVPDLPGYAARLVDDHTIEVDVSKEHSLNEIFARLSAAGVDVVSMRNKVNRLEELFMRLVEAGGASAGGRA
jgi:ABC-2 type transport system ATP-binding protein